mgnify:CR=1 FL=1
MQGAPIRREEEPRLDLAFQRSLGEFAQRFRGKGIRLDAEVESYNIWPLGRWNGGAGALIEIDVQQEDPHPRL